MEWKYTNALVVPSKRRNSWKRGIVLGIILIAIAFTFVDDFLEVCLRKLGICVIFKQKLL